LDLHLYLCSGYVSCLFLGYFAVGNSLPLPPLHSTESGDYPPQPHIFLARNWGNSAEVGKRSASGKDTLKRWLDLEKYTSKARGLNYKTTCGTNPTVQNDTILVTTFSIMSWTLFYGALAVALLSLGIRTLLSRKQPPLPPGPRGLPFLGNLLAI
jgi:hypothetical protein